MYTTEEKTPTHHVALNCRGRVCQVESSSVPGVTEHGLEEMVPRYPSLFRHCLDDVTFRHAIFSQSYDLCASQSVSSDRRQRCVVVSG